MVDGHSVKHLEKVVQLEIQTKCPGSGMAKEETKQTPAKKDESFKSHLDNSRCALQETDNAASEQ